MNDLPSPPHTLTNDTMRDVIVRAEQLVANLMADNDVSHDFEHVNRVRRMAVSIATTIPNVDILVVELAALFHDLIDHKYVQIEQYSQRLDLLRQVMEGVSLAQKELVLRIVQNTGYSIEKRLREQGNWSEWHENCHEFHCVQDADRIDAMGAVGIFRVCCFAATKNNPLIGNERSVIQHCYDKLLVLKDTMKTAKGRTIAAHRHEIMLTFVNAVESEVDLADFVDIVS